jgi:hypothetical protein
MSGYLNEEYELSNDKDVDSLLAELPIEVILENIKEQIDDPLSTSVDYTTIVTEKCELLKEDYEDNEDEIQNINNFLSSFYLKIINYIDNKFQLDFDLLDVTNSEIITYGEILYNFLILRYRKNVSSYIYKYIKENKKSIVEDYESTSKKKDVSTINAKKQIKNKDDIVIISNISSIISSILNLDIDSIDFVKYACDNDNYEGKKIRNLINEGKIGNNFTYNYLRILIDDNDDIIDEIQNEVRYKIISK